MREIQYFSREVEVVTEKPDHGSRLITLFENIFEQVLNLERVNIPNREESLWGSLCR